MSESFSLADTLAVADLKIYLSRAARVEEGSVRLIAASGVLAVYSAILYPHGLFDRTPTVLGLRTFATDQELSFDKVVPVRSLLDRVARAEAAGEQSGPVGLSMPLEVSTVTWAGITPPRRGWRHVGEAAPDAFERTAKSGIEEIATAVPEGTGTNLVQRVRYEVWGQPIPGVEYVPAGAAFAAFTLGFLAPDEQLVIYETGPWTRLTSRGGHVLVRQKPWRLKP